MTKDKWLTTALWLSVITIIYNIIEGIVSVYFGATDDTLVLLGFGVDSFVEVISGIGILHMVLRMQRSKIENFDKFERLALRITGVSFILLALGLIAGSILNVVNKSKPETTLAGIIIASISIITMYFLMKYKLKTGKALNSEAIIADAHCTKTCLYLSFILLISSLLYEFVKINYIDVAGSLGIAWYAFSEGRESLEKAKKNQLSCSCGENCH
ncbi:MAG: cation transporter [Lentimicrobiaceae bacterium]|jgi:divalent metal cation (Fe/Co/Zn/Cd) transporter